MATLEQIYQIIDQLPHEQLEQLNTYIQHHRSATVWAVTRENIRAIEQLMQPIHALTAQMSDEEIDTAVNEALTEVRREHKT